MTSRPRPRPAIRHGLTLIEATIAMMILGMVLVSVMQGVGLSAKLQHRTADELRGAALAKELADRVAAYDYDEPVGAAPLPTIGVDSGEILGDAGTFDDIDDWHGHTESPPAHADGTAMGFLTGWNRSVAVRWVLHGAPSTDTGAEDGAKLIVVVVTRPDGSEVGRVSRLALDSENLRGH
ncbi:MAG: prepilin-type N-terminal cleavage/methylation domain-containing protein [Phycisphaerales bacterium]|nr:prepilin-type N-terminal cleavage/methylation domain-containing protein [Phycisphaerales bacterium]